MLRRDFITAALAGATASSFAMPRSALATTSEDQSSTVDNYNYFSNLLQK